MQRVKVFCKYIVGAVFLIVLGTKPICASKAINSETSCLQKMVFFANEIDLDRPADLDAAIKLGDRLGIGNCDFRACRGVFAYKKSISLIVLKLMRYFKKTEPNVALDLLPIITASNGTKKIVYEFFYLARKEEFRGFPHQEIQFFSPLEVLSYIQNDKGLKKDPELKRWIILQDQVPYNPKF